MSICFPRATLFFLSFLSLIDVIYIKISNAHSLTAVKWNFLERWAEGKFADNVYFLFILFFFWRYSIRGENRSTLNNFDRKVTKFGNNMPTVDNHYFFPVPVKAIFFLKNWSYNVPYWLTFSEICWRGFWKNKFGISASFPPLWRISLAAVP